MTTVNTLPNYSVKYPVRTPYRVVEPVPVPLGVMNAKDAATTSTGN